MNENASKQDEGERPDMEGIRERLEAATPGPWLSTNRCKDWWMLDLAALLDYVGKLEGENSALVEQLGKLGEDWMRNLNRLTANRDRLRAELDIVNLNDINSGD